MQFWRPKVKTLGEVLPHIENEWIKPILLLAVLIAVGTSETVMAGQGLYQWMGWPAYTVSFAIAVLQVLSSHTWGHRLAHNQRRRIRVNSRTGKERADSEPRQNPALPATVSLVAGFASGIIASIFFTTHGWIGWIVSWASPSMAIASALLVGNEAVVQREQRKWEEKMAQVKTRRTSNAPVKSRRKDRTAPHLEFKIAERDGGICFFCKTKPQASEMVTIRFSPQKKARAMNLVTSCLTCAEAREGAIPSEDEIRKFQIHLINRSALAAKEKIWALKHLGLGRQQKDIAALLDVSASYVSTSVTEMPEQLPKEILAICKQIETVA